MKYLLCLIALAIPVTASATTLEWDRNTEADMDRYPVYACFEPECKVEPIKAMHQGTVPQTAVGVKPIFLIDLEGKEGQAAVTAKDKLGNESTLSAPYVFDKTSPKAPVNLRGQ